MREVSSDWVTYVENTTEKTLVKCLRVETVENVVYGTTTHTRDLIFDGVTYYAAAGLLDTAIARTEGFSVDNMEFTMVLTDAMHVAIEAGKFDAAKCYFFLVDYTDLDKGSIPLSTGYIGEITRDAGIVKAEILGLMSRLGRKSGRVYSVECDAVLGDDRCQVPMLDREFTMTLTLDTTLDTITRSAGSFELNGISLGSSIRLAGSALGNDGVYSVIEVYSDTVAGLGQALVANETASFTVTLLNNRTFAKTVDTVSEASPRRMFSMSDNEDAFGEDMPDHWCFAGVVEFTSGLNIGERRDVSSHIGVAIECYLDFPFNIEPGDAFTISVGCDLLKDTCRDKFDNVVNHRGFPFAPTNEEIFYVVSPTA